MRITPFSLAGAGCVALLLSSTLLLQSCAPRGVTEYYPGGQTKREGQTQGGIQVGQWHYWYGDGKPQAEGAWLNDKQDGAWRYWWPNGSLQAEGSYSNGGQRTGIWRNTYANGQIASEGAYQNDRQDGEWSYWYSNGTRFGTGSFVDGLRSGLWRSCDQNGHQVSQQLFYQGVAVGPTLPSDAAVALGGTFEVLSAGDAAGAHWWAMLPGSAGQTLPVTYPGLAVDGVFAFVRADGSGRASSSHDGHGVAEAWYSDGVLAETGDTAHGAKVGTWRYFRTDGSLLAAIDTAAAAAPAPDIAQAVHSIDLLVSDTETLAITPANAPAVAALPASPASAPAVAPAAGAPALSPTQQLPTFWTKREEGSASDWITHYEHSIDGLPAVSPQPQLPSFWTKHEEGSAASWIGQYEHGGAVATDSYAPDASVDSTRSDLLGKPLPQTRFLDTTGEIIDLSTYHKPLVVVVMRGFSGQVCLYCAAQTVALCKEIDAFHKAGAEVIVVYPGPAESAPAFLRAVDSLQHAAPPMPVALDISLNLVRAIGIEDNLARPTSLVVDKDGIIRFAYVGKTIADRPSADDLLHEVQRIVE